ncbi:MAG: hypothetical protein Q7R68_10960 [Nitrospirales bacterium]|nr:hypothetical protein [Nitrospirales bacterium]
MIDFAESDKQSATWRKMKAYLKELLERRRGELELNKTPEETERLRGRIAELKHLMKMDEDQVIEDLLPPA